MLSLNGCIISYFTGEAGIGKQLDWDSVPGWEQDRHAEAWPALLQGCQRLETKPSWDAICLAARQLEQPDDAAVRNFIEAWFVPYRIHGKRNKKIGLITGYYEPLLFGSQSADQRFKYPLYAPPEDLVRIDIEALFPDLKGQPVRGRLLEGHRIVPFYSRSDIDQTPQLLKGNELLWVDDRDALFFLQIQGSGRVQLPNGRTVGVGYADQNGHPYVSIGKVLLQRGELELEEISLFSIRQWLRENTEAAEELLHQNPSYVFFRLDEELGDGPLGALRVPLTAQRSVAVDPNLVPLGSPLWLMTNYPGDPERKYHRLMLAQDTGGAIKGAVRADVFWGHGNEAEQAAGVMKEKGRIIVFLPKATAQLGSASQAENSESLPSK